MREALRTLEISGFITLKRGPTGGAFVAASDPAILNSQLTSALRVTDFSVADLTQAMRAITVMLLDAALPTLNETDLQAMEANIKEAEAVIDDPQRRSTILIQFYGSSRKRARTRSSSPSPIPSSISCSNGWSGSARLAEIG